MYFDDIGLGAYGGNLNGVSWKLRENELARAAAPHPVLKDRQTWTIDPKERQAYLWPFSSLSASFECRAARAGSAFCR